MNSSCPPIPPPQGRRRLIARALVLLFLLAGVVVACGNLMWGNSLSASARRLRTLEQRVNDAEQAADTAVIHQRHHLIQKDESSLRKYHESLSAFVQVVEESKQVAGQDLSQRESLDEIAEAGAQLWSELDRQIAARDGQPLTDAAAGSATTKRLEELHARASAMRRRQADLRQVHEDRLRMVWRMSLLELLILGLVPLAWLSRFDRTTENVPTMILPPAPRNSTAAPSPAVAPRPQVRSSDETPDADQRKDHFLATLAHELRNPLSALTSGTQLILLNPRDPAQVAEVAALLQRQCAHLKQLVDDVLDVSRISQGKLNLHVDLVCLQDVLRQAVETTRPAIEASRHHFQTELTDVHLFVRGDGLRLAQVVSNLLINAAKYTPPGGQITLSLTTSGNEAVIAVCDNGIGIPSDMIEQIFELFSQVDSSYTRSQGGLGIGLTLARTLANLHGGRIDVSSPGTNLGSTFTVRLPLASSELGEAMPIPQRAPSTGELPHRRILVVDDNRAAVHLLSRLLNTLGQTVEKAQDGVSALSAIDEFRPEVVISDIAMPDISGYDLARKIRENHAMHQPVLVALTGYGQASDREAAYAAGFDLHLTKPVSMEDLANLLKRISHDGQ